MRGTLRLTRCWTQHCDEESVFFFRDSNKVGHVIIRYVIHQALKALKARQIAMTIASRSLPRLITVRRLFPERHLERAAQFGSDPGFLIVGIILGIYSYRVPRRDLGHDKRIHS